MEDMLVEIKADLSEFQDIEVYDGYQIIAEIWKNALTHDTELIAANGFYETGRTREPNMITKGPVIINVRSKTVGLERLFLMT